VAGKTPRAAVQDCASAEIIVHKDPGTSYKKILALPDGGVNARSSTAANERGGTLRITIKANDITALRASMNSIMRDLQVVADVRQQAGKALFRKKAGKTAKVKVYKNIE